VMLANWLVGDENSVKMKQFQPIFGHRSAVGARISHESFISDLVSPTDQLMAYLSPQRFSSRSKSAANRGGVLGRPDIVWISAERVSQDHHSMCHSP
jgi:hypothetical protein